VEVLILVTFVSSSQ